ncbi:hypothetical protein [Bradyrhizobium sp.]|jgi:hypothetical protein|uniref:hypothetical protein n=1 Tax=Bradyrhizobium sp. TaxID=376 RepID=UPI002B7A9843|nr:hypothetical protein [Bradyrhizobium sp.]HWX57807.1 hypothetical protein [Bradyrhizobium sp.]
MRLDACFHSVQRSLRQSSPDVGDRRGRSENFRVMFMQVLPEIVCEEKLIVDEQDAAACK